MVSPCRATTSLPGQDQNPPVGVLHACSMPSRTLTALQPAAGGRGRLRSTPRSIDRKEVAMPSNRWRPAGWLTLAAACALAAPAAAHAGALMEWTRASAAAMPIATRRNCITCHGCPSSRLSSSPPGSSSSSIGRPGSRTSASGRAAHPASSCSRSAYSCSRRLRLALASIAGHRREAAWAVAGIHQRPPLLDDAPIRDTGPQLALPAGGECGSPVISGARGSCAIAEWAARADSALLRRLRCRRSPSVRGGSIQRADPSPPRFPPHPPLRRLITTAQQRLPPSPTPRRCPTLT